MITGIGAISTSRTVDVQGNAVARSAEPAKAAAAASTEETEVPTSPATSLAALGAPIDTDKVAAIRAGIASGSYKVDAKAIADRMMALDLPVGK